jgi:transcriptional regulator with XRE-family HTH domain
MVHERLKAVREALNMTQAIFAQSLGLKQGSYSDIEKGKTKTPVTPQTELILKHVHNVNIEYLYGNSEQMFCSEGEYRLPVKTLPRIPYNAEAGKLTDVVEGITEYECERVPVVSAFPKYDFTIRVSGRSMEPYYYAGDEVACLRINEARFIQWGRVHVLDTEQGIVIKRIYENGDCIRCASFNPEYPDFNVPKADIRSYNLVVGALRL